MRSILMCLFLLLGGGIASANTTPHVLVTLKPIYGLVASIMQGVGEPTLLLPDGASPHTFQLKPSNLKELQQASLVIWVGPELEVFMVKPLEQVSSKKLITLMNIPHLHLLPQRTGRAWQHEHHDHSDWDPHIWLSTDNAKIIARTVTEYLSHIDPSNAKYYHANLKKCIKNISQLKSHLNKMLLPVQSQPFLVYHDGYQYFEKEFHLNGIGTMILNPHLPLSANGVKAIQNLIQAQHIKCVFRETEFKDNTIMNALNGLDVKVPELDPLGAREPLGPGNYEKTMLQLGKTMAECLKSPLLSASP